MRTPKFKECFFPTYDKKKIEIDFLKMKIENFIYFIQFSSVYKFKFKNYVLSRKD